MIRDILTLEKFLQNEDPQKWWRLSAGEMQNIFDEAIDLIDELKRKQLKTRAEAIGWAYADCCADLDSGKDPRKTLMGSVLDRANIDLGS